jgi:hypothetical protein
VPQADVTEKDELWGFETLKNEVNAMVISLGLIKNSLGIYTETPRSPALRVLIKVFLGLLGWSQF